MSLKTVKLYRYVASWQILQRNKVSNFCFNTSFSIYARVGTKNPTQKTHKKPTVKNPAKSGFFGFFKKKSMLWPTKRLRIVLGYIHAF